jgi:tetratricopeptide (TPR) repeat protein
MSANSKKISAFVVGALIILISLQFFPRTPSVDEGEVSVKKASLLIEQGEIMEGVTLLKTVLEVDPNNLDAIWELGKLSMQSQQFDKAVERFEKFVSITTGEEKVSGLISLSDAQFFNEDREKALISLSQASTLNTNQELEIEIQERISIINKN